MKFVTSRKGKTQILLDGHAYNKHSKPNYWCCSSKNTCNGLGYYENGLFTMKREHRCAFNVGMMKAKAAKMDLIQFAGNSTQTTSEIVTQKLSTYDAGI